MTDVLEVFREEIIKYCKDNGIALPDKSVKVKAFIEGLKIATEHFEKILFKSSIKDIDVLNLLKLLESKGIDIQTDEKISSLMQKESLPYASINTCNTENSVIYRFSGIEKKDFFPNEELIELLESFSLPSKKSEDIAISVVKRTLVTNPREEVTLSYDISGLDSLDAIELVMDLEEELEIVIPDEETKKLETFETVKDLANYIHTNLISRSKT
jgi:acyl carrier protein